MSTRTKAILITLVFGIASAVIGPMLWQPPAGGASPQGIQLPFFIILSILESIAFGLGVAFLILGWPLVKSMPQELRRSAGVLYVAITWFLVSWWPHDNMHMSNGESVWGLIVIEYLFHVTLIVAAIVIAYEFFVLFGRCLVLAQRK